MEGATQAWHSMTYLEGILFTFWIVGLYWSKKRMDLHFDTKLWKNRVKLKKTLSSNFRNKIEKKWF